MPRTPARITISKKLPKLDAKALVIGLLKEFDATFKLGAGVFVTTLARRVNLQTGESHASLEPLARDTGVRIQHGKQNPFRRKSSLDRTTGGEVPGSKPRGFSSGWALGADAYIVTVNTSPELEFRFDFILPTFQLSVQDDAQACLDEAEAAMKKTLRDIAFPVMDNLVDHWLKTGKVRPRLL